MKRSILIAAAVFLSLPSFSASPQGSSASQQASPTASVVHAADAFLATLTPEQRKKVVYAFDDNVQRTNWSNLPTGTVHRGGMSIIQMTIPQQQAMMKLLSTVLSPMGFEKMNEIRDADQDFAINNPDGHGVFGKVHYYISILGTPSMTEPWMIKVDGHHLALNITIVGSKGILAPMLTGAAPGTFKLNGKVIRPLGRESDKAITLMESLDSGQRKKAVLTYKISDLVLGPGEDGKKIVPEGLKVSEMYPLQKEMLLDLISEWADIVRAPWASVRMAQIKSELDDTYFAWSGFQTGGVGTNINAYFRIQGPHLVIEFSPQAVIQPPPPGNNNVLTGDHVHTIYRDPTNDYASSTLKP